MADPFESYDDLEDADERLQAADPAERRVAIIALGHSGDPAAVGHLSVMVSDPDAGVRQQLAMAFGEFDGPESAAALVKLLVDTDQVVATAAAKSMAELKDPACADVILPLTKHPHAFVRMGALRALETQSILDCADMAAHASLYREESRWGLYHLRTDFPDKDNENWFCHTLLSKQDGRMTSEKRKVQPYVVPIADEEKDLYDKQRIRASA